MFNFNQIKRPFSNKIISKINMIYKLIWMQKNL